MQLHGVVLDKGEEASRGAATRRRRLCEGHTVGEDRPAREVRLECDGEPLEGARGAAHPGEERRRAGMSAAVVDEPPRRASAPSSAGPRPEWRGGAAALPAAASFARVNRSRAAEGPFVSRCSWRSPRVCTWSSRGRERSSREACNSAPMAPQELSRPAAPGTGGPQEPSTKGELSPRADCCALDRGASARGCEVRSETARMRWEFVSQMRTPISTSPCEPILSRMCSRRHKEQDLAK